jgi:hypothetical protein
MLLGTIVGESNAIAIFLDETSHSAIQLRIDQVHGGWILVSVRGRVASFERDHREATVTLAPLGPARAGEADASGILTHSLAFAWA